MGKQEMEDTDEFKALSKEEKEYRRYEIPECISIWICDFELNDEEIDAISGFSKDDILKRKEILTKRR